MSPNALFHQHEQRDRCCACNHVTISMEPRRCSSASKNFHPSGYPQPGGDVGGSSDVSERLEASRVAAARLSAKAAVAPSHPSEGTTASGDAIARWPWHRQKPPQTPPPSRDGGLGELACNLLSTREPRRRWEWNRQGLEPNAWQRLLGEKSAQSRGRCRLNNSSIDALIGGGDNAEAKDFGHARSIQAAQ